MSLPTCANGHPAFAIKPGMDSRYGAARDLFGLIDKRMKPILIAREIADEVWCAEPGCPHCSRWAPPVGAPRSVGVDDKAGGD